MLANMKIRFLNMQTCRNFVQLILVKRKKDDASFTGSLASLLTKPLIDEEFVEFNACTEAQFQEFLNASLPVSSHFFTYIF